MFIKCQVSTERAWRIYVQYFAIQYWKEWGCIKLIHIAGIINFINNSTKSGIGLSFSPLTIINIIKSKALP